MSKTMFWIKLFVSTWIFTMTSVVCDDVGGVDEELSKQSMYYGMISIAVKSPRKSVCLKEMSDVANGILNGDRWAIKLIDASGAPRSGLLWGNTFWLGNRKQCESSMVLKDVEKNPFYGPVAVETEEGITPFPVSYYGAYFVHDSEHYDSLNLQNEHRITLGICLPSSCEESEIFTMLQLYFDQNLLHQQRIYNMTMKMESVRRIQEDFKFLKNKSTIAFGIIILTIGILCIYGTHFAVTIYYPTIGKRKRLNEETNSNAYIDDDSNSIEFKLRYRLLMCFDVLKNNRSIFNTEHKKDAVRCIHGLRVLTMLHVVISHGCLFQLFYIDNLSYSISVISRDYISQLMLVAHFHADTFYCISGYLVAYLYYNANNNTDGFLAKTKLLFTSTTKRLERILPSYSLEILIAFIITSWRINSMIFKAHNNDDIVCQEYWWRNILFINTWYPQEEMCMLWSWYISNDLQFYIVTTFLLILSTTHFKKAAYILTIIFASSIGYTVYTTYVYEYLPYFTRWYGSRDLFYYPPLMRINTYLIGSVSGAIVYKFNKNLPLKKNVIKLIWIGFVCLSIVLIFILGSVKMNLPISMVYVPLSRILWSVCVAWVIIACETGNGGIVNTICCWKIWIPLSHVNFWVYFLNPIVIFFLSSFNERALEGDFFTTIGAFPGYLLYTYSFAYVLTLTVELPMANVIKVIKNKNSSKLVSKNIKHRLEKHGIQIKSKIM